MGSSAKTEYCAFTKAVEHLGDRWSFLIVRELALFGSQGFNTLATGLPGHVSRPIARGLRSWRDAMAEGSVRVYGAPELVAALPGWFVPVERDVDARPYGSLPEKELALTAVG